MAVELDTTDFLSAAKASSDAICMRYKVSKVAIVHDMASKSRLTERMGSML